MKNLVQLFAVLVWFVLSSTISYTQIVYDRGFSIQTRGILGPWGTSLSPKSTFTGRYDYSIIGNTMSPDEAPGDNCSKNSNSSATLSIPSGATVEAAYLYWSVSGLVDKVVNLNSSVVWADDSMKFELVYGGDYGQFSGSVADVTSIVQSLGSTSYTVSNLNWSTGFATQTQSIGYCNSGAAYGGWALVVIYSEDDLPVSTINTFEGFQGLWPEGDLIVTLGIDEVSECKGNATFTHVSWEGDNYKSENFYINNDFQGANTYNGYSDGGLRTANLDIDTYDITDLVDSGDDILSIKTETWQQNTPYGNAVEFFIHQFMIVKVEEGEAFFQEVFVNDATDCETNDGELVVDPYIGMGTTLPIDIYYTFEEAEYYAGSYNSAGDNKVGGLEPGTYTNVRIVDANGCEATYDSIFTIGPSSLECLPQEFCSGGLGAASPYNLLTFGTVNSLGNGGDIQGKVAIGGDINNVTINIGQDHNQGTNLEDNATSRTFIVGGDINNSNGVTISHGRFSFTGAFGGSISVYDPSEPGNLLYISGNNQTDLIDQYRQTPPFDFAYVSFQMKQFSQTLQTLSPDLFSSAITGNVVVDEGKLELDGMSKDKDLYIFYTSTTELASVSEIELVNIYAHATIVVNVGGNSIDLTNVDISNLSTFSSQLLFNFYEASSVILQDFNGTLLAPEAAMTASNGTIRGQMIVNSVLSMEGCTLLNYPFSRCIAPLVDEGVDYGDAPASYGEVSHVYKNNSSLISYLGTSVDYETAGFYTNDASGDDFDNQDDENGVVFIGGPEASPGETKTINLTVFSNFQDVFVNIWIDLNQDGVFDPVSELVVKNFEFDKDLHDPQNFVFNRSTQFTIPLDAVCGDTYMRVRMESDGDILPSGQIIKGEVEDYVFTVVCDQGGSKDYGDAAITFGTAAHEVVAGVSLGELVDTEQGTQGTAFSNGDDENGEDDEDGVVFTNGPIILQDERGFIGKSYSVRVNNTSGSTYYLSAWIDTDADGEFDTQFITDKSFGTGVNQDFLGPTIQIPFNQNLCGDIATVRFRLSDVPGVGASGGDVTGEVEDYALIMACSEETYVDQGILPVEWLSVTAEMGIGEVDVNWATASETNNSHFEVEKSLDGIHFQVIGTEMGAGFSEEIQYYSLKDPQPANGVQYYRVKQIDFDGSYEYSQLVEVYYQQTTSLGVINAYPSPTTGAFYLEAQSTTQALAAVRVLTVSGKTVFHDEFEITRGTHTYPFDLSALPGGIYVFQWIQKGEIFTSKLLKQ